MAHQSPEHYPQPTETDPFVIYGLRLDLRDDPDLWRLTLSRLNEIDPLRAQQINVIAEEHSAGDIHLKENILKGFMLSEELKMRGEAAAMSSESANHTEANNVVGMSWLRKRREKRQHKAGRQVLSVGGDDVA
jgi:hypothetical protein